MDNHKISSQLSLLQFEERCLTYCMLQPPDHPGVPLLDSILSVPFLFGVTVLVVLISGFDP